MKVLALTGSPRKGGNSDILTDEFLRGAADAGAAVEKVYLDDHRIRPLAVTCDAPDEREDLRGDDDFPAVLETFLGADIVVFATPVYFQGVTAQVKCFLDRLGAYYRRSPYRERMRGKGYAVLCTHGAPDAREGEWVTRPMEACLTFTGGRYLGHVCASVGGKGKIREQPEALRAACELGGGAVREMAAGPAGED